jgi:cell division protein FtsZ
VHAGATVTHAPQQHDYSGLAVPSVWRSGRTQAAAKVDALASNGMDEIEIPAFLRKQAD